MSVVCGVCVLGGGGMGEGWGGDSSGSSTKKSHKFIS